MDFNRHGSQVGELGYGLAALSVDPPERSARLQRQLGLSFPLLCDPGREVIRAWGVLNARERGGIAEPATAVIGGGQRLWFERESMMRRVTAAELLAFLRGEQGSPRRRGVVPRVRDFRQALRGVKS